MTEDKVCGMVLGTAIGDQLGMPVETYTQEKIAERHGRITSYIDPDPDHKWFGGLKSRWTDDTQLTLVVAESLIAKKKIDMDDMATRHVAALKESDLGWGRSTKNSVKNLAKGKHWSKSGVNGWGNGLPMKAAPLALLYPDKVWCSELEFLAYMTHCNYMAAEAFVAQICAVKYCLLNNTPSRDEFMVRVVTGIKGINEFIGAPTIFEERLRAFNSLTMEFLPISEKLRLFGGANSEVHNSLPFCYSMFLENPTSIETLYNTINAGGDTDTNGSIVGALLGALNGTKIFPNHLVAGLWQRDRILDTADQLCEAFNIA